MTLALIELGGRVLGMDVRSAVDKSRAHGHRFAGLVGVADAPAAACGRSCTGECDDHPLEQCDHHPGRTCAEAGGDPSEDYPLGGSLEPHDVDRDSRLTD